MRPPRSARGEPIVRPGQASRFAQQREVGVAVAPGVRQRGRGRASSAPIAALGESAGESHVRRRPGTGFQPPFTFVWRFASGGPEARPPAGNSRESRVQHIYDPAGEKSVGVTITDGRGQVVQATTACLVTVLAGGAPALLR